jgi:glyoxylase-like metal-dependent hydrolase (beta-lactamase superfamily II)
MNVNAFYDPATYTLTYVVWDDSTLDAIIIDPVLDYDPASSTYSKESIDKVVKFVSEHNLNIHLILETHAHADHLTGSQFLKEIYPKADICIGENITKVQKTFKHVFNFKEFNENGVQFDRLLKEGDVITAGTLSIETINTPGHTPACVSYYITEKAVFTGDALFMHDYGTGRCDFPGGDSSALYESVSTKLYQLPDETKVYVGHDYQPNGRDVAYESTIALQKQHNPQLRASTTQSEFVEMRDTRDKTLKAPILLLQSLQVNIDAGHLPAKEDNGNRYLKIPFRPKG